MSTQHHTIERIRVDVRGKDHNRVSKVQQQFNYTLNTAGFLKQLETLLDSMVPAGEYLEIQTIEINWKNVRENQFQEMLLQEIETSIREKIKTSSRNEVKLLNQPTFEKEIYVHFLRFGVLRYPAGKNILERLYHEISYIKNRPVPELESILKEACSKDPEVWKRLYFLIGREGIISYAQRLHREVEKLIMELAKEFQAGETALNDPNRLPAEQEFWQKLMPMLEEHWTEEKIRAAFQFPDENTETLKERQVKEAGDLQVHRKEFKNITDKEIPITNAGIVLLWMDLGKLLRQLKWVEGKSFTDIIRQQQSVVLLHYICFGTKEIREENCLLCKILCNWPPDEPIDCLCIPGPEDFEAADRMLEDFVKNWRKEKKYSAHWFRKSFLEREGTLVKRLDGNWDLLVQQKTEDILIQKVSMVKYAWMQEMIFVHW